uniref:Reverse transcriptase Ty1/copia-type domain-containing protein n=1 Tax=Ananas comosus var. bracteatus TaxID=296719 RepID=A0A6V7QM79_ANACO|nr:unnamed protein product [Ananas comosus var. bracteatus]
MINEFEMTDMGHMAYYLGIEVSQKDEVSFISQKKYAGEILEKFQMADCKPVVTPIEIGLKLNKKGDGKLVNPIYFKQLVGSLRYLTATRSDITYGVGLISRYMEKPTQMHLQAAKRILR